MDKAKIRQKNRAILSRSARFLIVKDVRSKNLLTLILTLFHLRQGLTIDTLSRCRTGF